MALAGEILENKVTGEKIQWLKTSQDTEGQYLQYDWHIAPQSQRLLRHFHSYQTETIEVKEGALTVDCGGTLHLLTSGDSLTIEKGQLHQWWNHGDEPVQAVVTVEPALNTETQIEQLFGLCNDGQVTFDAGLPYLQQIVLSEAYDLKVAGLPEKTNSLTYRLLTSFASMLGYKKYYPKYSGERRKVEITRTYAPKQAS
ncbi:cupin domain-containing protein [Telluribacter sp. SYSU D00476]|uniref:cupin domain-containing protein n=1 Tax=Telluribacter sp. SYSU D00476 TaxID=2811430 RepID=UPI001FF6EFC0|nr:cupin domain-containing protein [Telluribacter sp. SYSU D00476]